MNSVQLKHTTVPQSDLYAQISAAYVDNLLRWLSTRGALQGILSLECLGNPENLFSSVGSGFHSLFVEPSKAALKGPEEFGKSLGTGAVDFGAKTVGGVVGFASSVTSSAGRILTTLAADDKYSKQRSENLKNTKGLGDGIAKGATQFGRGLFEGVTGLVTQPIQGAKKGGIVGGLKGVGKGLTGLVFKPAAGAIDLVSSTMAGVEAEALGAKIQHRFRTPRHVSPFGLVQDYSPTETYGVGFLRDNFRGPVISLRGQRLVGKYAKYMYVAHHCEEDVESRQEQYHMFMILKQKILVIESENLTSKAHSSTKVTFEFDPADVLQCTPVPGRGLELKMIDSSAIMLETHADSTSAKLGQHISLVATGARALRPPPGWIPAVFERPAQVAAATKAVRPVKDAAPQELETKEFLIHENQRNFPIIGWGKKMLPSDRKHFTLVEEDGGCALLEDVNPLPSWEWAGEWVTMKGDTVDGDGWEYAIDFPRQFAKSSFMKSVSPPCLSCSG